MNSKSKLPVAIAAIAGGSLLAFCCGLLLTVTVFIPAREGRGPLSRPTGASTISASPSVAVGPIARRTPPAPSPTATYSVVFSTPTPDASASSPEPSATSTTPGRPTPTATSPAFPFHYVEGSRLDEPQCTQPYLQGWVRDAAGAPLNGATVRWQYWNNTEYALSGDPELFWRDGEFKFTYYGQNPHTQTDFVLQIVESSSNPAPLSPPLQIHYAGCGTMGQITNIVFQRW